MQIWLDDIRPAPIGFEHTLSVNATIKLIIQCLDNNIPIELIDIDHDLGDYAEHGGDGYKLILWLIENNIYPPINCHSMNPVGKKNIESLVRRYWK